MKILVANRGEIAVRIIRACRLEGAETVAVFSDVDRAEPHVRLADEAVRLGPARPTESYLAIDRIVDAARRTNADAVHPGYGFLSENADFAQAVADAGLTFIGPSAEAIRVMGDKIAARKTMEAAGVPVVPGTLDPVADPRAAGEVAAGMGYPVMLKAVGGGGGKGIRVVEDPAEMESAFQRAASEARSSFGNAAVYLEKFLPAPRHIEIQVLADSHGNAIHLGERECSLQRRHQKIVEEAPSVLLTEEQRLKMGETALTAVRAIGYVNAGTIECLVDPSGGFYFLEMNTRLQVEHPVTEMVYRVDLVREQIRIARGERLRLSQEDVEPQGHAVEARIYAEDPDAGFLPSSGRIEHLELPGGPGVRLDSNLYPGQEISLHYDPILGKLIAFGSTRDSAIGRLVQALSEFRITGIRTTIPFLSRLLQHPDFLEGDFDTTFVDRRLEEIVNDADASSDEIAALAAALYTHGQRSRRSPVRPPAAGRGPSPWTMSGRRWNE